MGMFDPPGAQPPNEFDCKLQTAYQMKPGQTVTELIPTVIEATFSRQGCLPYAGPGPQVKSMGAYALDLVGLFDSLRRPVGYAAASQFLGNVWNGFTTWALNGSPAAGVGPNGPYADVGVEANDGSIGGGTYPFCRITLAAAPPVATHLWVFMNQGQVLGQVQIPNPEDVRITRDGVMVFPASQF